ncbi:Hypothetical_protein [Hexamita inflata]|uniref:Hypothetical_protein n=1 Tax=Hexamita inflata TaxID=28002 RepID=A0AA86R4X5_9EUKA|nr:Hypothetical protein HINF_LOCUS53843 [Hexamita inflata]
MRKRFLVNNSMYLPQPLLIERSLQKGSMSQLFSKDIVIEEPEKPLQSFHSLDLSVLNKSLHFVQQNTTVNKEFEQMNLTRASQRLQNQVQVQTNQLKQMFDYDLDRNTLLKRRAKLFSPSRFRK